MNLKNPIILALDIDDPKRALEISQELGSHLGCIKIGPRLLQKAGETWSREIAKHCPLFIDCKYFDIPNTMVSSVKSAFDAGASLVTIHALSGPKAMTELARLEKELNETRPFKILAVSVLTSFSQDTLPTALGEQKIDELVVSLVNDSLNSGLSGIVCSPHELNLLKNLHCFKVTPGIRDSQDIIKNPDDQVRIMSASEALKHGSNALVIGRPILKAADMKYKIQEILSSL